LLLGGNGIFGVVDFCGRPEVVQDRAKWLARRAIKQGARSDYGIFGAAALGRVSRSEPGDKFSSRSVPLPVIFSGEVYDQESTRLAASLSDSSSRWLIDGFQLNGNRFLAQLDGTFALALWQPKEQRLVLMTDQCGDGKLFVKRESEGLKFSSWLKLLCDGSETIDREATQEFLRFLYITPPRTIYRDIECLEPGNIFTLSRGMVVIETVNSTAAQASSSVFVDDAEASVQEFQSLLETSIRRRISARRVGVFLSSGIDSATLMAGCDQINPGQVEAFTVGFDTMELDESNAARAMADCLKVPHTTLRFNLAEYRTAFENIAHEFDQPFGDPSCLPLACVARVARERVEVVCDGSGSDGLFGAPIPRHLRFALNFSATLPRSARRSFAMLINSTNLFNLSSYGMLFDFDDPEELFVTWSGWKKREMEDLLGEPIRLDDTGFYRAFRSAKHADAQQQFDAIGKFPPDDGRFEAAAMEDLPIVLPYHDAAISGFIHRQPQWLRFEGSVTVLLRRLFARYYVNFHDIVVKRYFTFPLHSFIACDDFALVRRFLSDASLLRCGLVDPARVASWIDRYLAGDQSLLFKIWSLLVLHSWLEARTEDT
jgi:asparagine synthase (glutamine-hydrolysing)